MFWDWDNIPLSQMIIREFLLYVKRKRNGQGHQVVTSSFFVYETGDPYVGLNGYVRLRTLTERVYVSDARNDSMSFTVYGIEVIWEMCNL